MYLSTYITGMLWLAYAVRPVVLEQIAGPSESLAAVLKVAGVRALTRVSPHVNFQPLSTTETLKFNRVHHPESNLRAFPDHAALQILCSCTVTPFQHARCAVHVSRDELPPRTFHTETV